MLGRTPTTHAGDTISKYLIFFTFQLKQQLTRASAGPKPQDQILLPSDVALDLFGTARPDAALRKLL